MVRGFLLVMTAVAGCAHGGQTPAVSKCTDAKGADPGACVAVANAKQTGGDDRAAAQYVEAAVDALDTAPACLRDHEARGCFQAVALLLDQPVGLLADVHVSQDLQVLAPKQFARDKVHAALKTMCTTPARDPGEQQRACIVLGDLDEIDRTQRCGDKCDEPNEGYAHACKLGKTSLDASIRQVYATDACGIAASAKRGSSIADGVATIQRIRDDARARVVAAKAAADREATRLALLAEAAAQESSRATREAYEAGEQQLVRALETANWELAYELVKKRDAKSPLSAAAVTALGQNWDSFTGWAIQQGTPMSAYLDLGEHLSGAPSLATQVTSLRERALVDLQARAKQTRGAGGQWLYAALVGRVTGDTKQATDLYQKLAAQTRVSLAIDRLSPACAPLMSVRPGRKVRATSTLACSVVAEHKWTEHEPMIVKQRVVKGDQEEEVETQVMNDVEHRAFAVTVHGTVTAAGKQLQVDFEDVLDDGDGSSNHTFEHARAAAMEAIVRAAIEPLEAADAAKAYAAAKQALTQERQGAAENGLVIHGLLAGSSPELDELLSQFGVTFPELLPH